MKNKLITAFTLSLLSCTTNGTNFNHRNYEELKEVELREHSPVTEKGRLNQIKALDNIQENDDLNLKTKQFKALEMFENMGGEWSIYHNSFNPVLKNTRICYYRNSNGEIFNKILNQETTSEISLLRRKIMLFFKSEIQIHHFHKSLVDQDNTYLVFTQEDKEDSPISLVLKYEKKSQIEVPSKFKKDSNRYLSTTTKNHLEPKLINLFKQRKFEVPSDTRRSYQAKEKIAKTFSFLNQVLCSSSGHEDGQSRRIRQRGLDRDKY